MKIKLLAVVGAGRIGSTLIEKILGQEESITSVGELDHLWAGLEDDFICGCRKPFQECEFWRNILYDAFGGLENVNANEIVNLREKVDKAALIPYILFPQFQNRTFNENLTTYKSLLEKLYSSVYSKSKTKYILDASKSPAYIHILNQIENIEIHTIHLVRDSRAVAYSRTKKKLVTYATQDEKYMDRDNALVSALKWNSRNLLSQSLKHYTASYTCIKYEDFVSDPKSQLEKIFLSLGEQDYNLDYITESGVYLSDNHAIFGNPSSRFKSGLVPIRLDQEWEKKLGYLEKLTVTSLTFPLLLRYGYK
jgi:hypothetical protein